MISENVKTLIESIFKCYENGESLTTQSINNINTVRKFLNNDMQYVSCKTTECVYNNCNKCNLTKYNINERLSINDCGECLSFSDDIEDLY